MLQRLRAILPVVLLCLVLGFGLGMVVRAWTGPGGAPPTGNPAGGVTGSGTATRAAFWATGSSLGSNANFYWDNTNSRLGIGLTNPATPIEVASGNVRVRGSGDRILIASNSALAGNKALSLFAGGAEASLQYDSSGSFQIISNTKALIEAGTFAGNTRLLIDSSGNVGIGGTSSPEGLQVNLAASETARGADNVRFGVLSGTPRVILEDSGFTQWLVDNSGGVLRFFNPGTVRMSLTTAGRLDVTGDISWGGTLQGGTVPWARLGSFPAGCGAGFAVQVIGTTPTCIAVGGAGGTPGGSNTHVQYNNSGAFGGDAGFTYGAGGNDLSLGGGGSQAGNFVIKNSVGTTTVSLNSDTNSWFNSGNFSIGTSSVGQKLYVVGNVQVDDGGSGNGIMLQGADRPLITRNWDTFTSGGYAGVGRWGLFMEPSTLTLGIPNVGGPTFQVKAFNANSSSVNLLTVNTSGRLDIAGDAYIAGSQVCRANGTGCPGGGSVSGSGTTNTLPKWTGSTALGNSQMTDDGTWVRMGGTLQFSPGGGDVYIGGGSQDGNLFVRNSSSTTKVDIDGFRATMKFYSSSANGDDGVIGTAPYDSGLNIVGINTGAGYRQIRFWGSLIQNETPAANSLGTTTINGQSVCLANGTNCPTRTTATCTSATVNDPNCQAWCPSGTAIGGGIGSAATTDSVTAVASNPVTGPNGWNCGLTRSGTSTTFVTCYVICQLP
ncbi:MAG: hypothetical protein A2682_03300 [Candidatus Terrybacteria bacterium RIFCSPHIGHO2_01_FULL_58_15]|uniref:Uncharacterized protein n=1 Tax=Terrybacteria sp. (strain RIFCSPHIGHO2_01_FULL_58_15) TaxID=1802363 RepID=A0A1G2PP45_TERXR|nr:MAG: hypothetical protein A2682_03300 [Candidatus Terrybacteria bacterium RIFCSPHIGHO2_01_FULL_58_15]